MMIAINIIVAAIYGFGVYLESIKQLHMVQLEGYKPKQYWWWLKGNLMNLFSNFILFSLALIIFVIINIKGYNNQFGYLLVFIWIAGNIYIIYRNSTNKKKAKKPLVFTHRATRLFVLNLILLFLWGILAYIFTLNIVRFILCLSVIKLLLCLNMMLSTAIIYPFEMFIQYRYYKMAQSKIKGMKDLKVIGITGSFGKTSTKYFVKTILSEKYNTLMTPESYNTPMGITKVIREQLNNEHEIFVCEMGARNVGDIRTLCRLVNPEIGILTSIGPQHLETFKSISNIIKTKYELIQALPYYGIAIFNGDNDFCLELAKKTGIESYIYSINNKGEDINLFANDIENLAGGLKFRVSDGESIDFICQSNLLGKHNISNMLAAISTAIKLGLTIDEIKSGISKIKPVPHRLQILDSRNGVTVIDDAFNSNPAGALEALETIKDFSGNAKIVITPGMVELGAIEYEENRKFGKAMAKCCDFAILVGVKRSTPIIEGLKANDFPDEKIIVVGNINEASAELAKIVKPGDVVLFENDLPDNYNE